MNYHDYLAEVALRVGAFVESQPASLQVAYATRPLTVDLFDSADFPFSSLKKSLYMTEKRTAQAIASRKDQVWRSYLLSHTASLAHKAEIPKFDRNSIPIIGVWSGVYDASNGTECEYMDAGYITRRVRLAASGYLKSSEYKFNADGDRILHTRTNVIIECCVYDDATQVAAIDNNGAVLLSGVPMELYVNGAVSMLQRDETFTVQAGIARTYFNNFLEGIEGKAA